MEEVDVVVTWVDGNDPDWKKRRAEYSDDKESISDIRFRNWDNLHYLLRSIEQNMPWVRKIHLVTCGHLPKWINVNSEKLNIVKHEDFIPEKYLPTFNSNAIELNMHRIPGIADRIVCFNDDTFVVKPTVKEEFFKGGRPCDMASISPQPIYRNIIMNIELNNLKIINDYFSIEDIKKERKKWLAYGKYGQFAIRTRLFMNFKSIIGIFQPHVQCSLLKETFDKLWELEPELLDSTCSNRFRSSEDVNIWLLRSWQLVSGNFNPRKASFGQLVSASDSEAVRYYLSRKSKCKLICINDDDTVKDFEAAKQMVNKELQILFPDKSAMEI